MLYGDWQKFQATYYFGEIILDVFSSQYPDDDKGCKSELRKGQVTHYFGPTANGEAWVGGGGPGAADNSMLLLE